MNDLSDSCPSGDLNWISNSSTDYDLDGCQDNSSEDTDDDNDSVLDSFDSCLKGNLGWTSSSSTDYDSDGCRDISSEDRDDDNDSVLDSSDDCQTGDLGWTSSFSTDHDSDGCQDANEDTDDDNDEILDSSDSCYRGNLGWTSSSFTDYDSDGCRDISFEDRDDDNDGFWDINDDCQFQFGNSTINAYGCPDNDGDGWTEYGGAADVDKFPNDHTQWSDTDSDGYGDNMEGTTPDECPETYGTSLNDRIGCLDSDGDGWSDLFDAFSSDSTEWFDTDSDGIGNNKDNDDDGDGVFDNNDQFPLDNEEWDDNDLDGIGDNQDHDDDNDNWSDEAELSCNTNKFLKDDIPIDTDSDYICDIVDADDDGDGYLDEVLGNDIIDYCPLLAGNSTMEYYGCPDVDGDGLADFADKFTNDPTRTWDRDNDGLSIEDEGKYLELVAEEDMENYIIVMFFLIMAVISGIYWLIARTISKR